MICHWNRALITASRCHVTLPPSPPKNWPGISFPYRTFKNGLDFSPSKLNSNSFVMSVGWVIYHGYLFISEIKDVSASFLLSHIYIWVKTVGGELLCTGWEGCPFKLSGGRERERWGTEGREWVVLGCACVSARVIDEARIPWDQSRQQTCHVALHNQTFLPAQALSHCCISS